MSESCWCRHLPRAIPHPSFATPTTLSPRMLRAVAAAGALALAAAWPARPGFKLDPVPSFVVESYMGRW